MRLWCSLAPAIGPTLRGGASGATCRRYPRRRLRSRRTSRTSPVRLPMLGAAGAPQLLLEKQAPLREVTLDPGEDPTKHQRLRVQGRRDAVRFAFGEIE